MEPALNVSILRLAERLHFAVESWEGRVVTADVESDAVGES